MARSMYGVAEIAEELGVRRDLVAQWRRRGRLPRPDEQLATGPVWLYSTIAQVLEDESPWSVQDLGMWENRAAMLVRVRDTAGNLYNVALSWNDCTHLKLQTAAARKRFVLRHLLNPEVIEAMEARRMEDDSEITPVFLKRANDDGSAVQVKPLP